MKLAIHLLLKPTELNLFSLVANDFFALFMWSQNMKNNNEYEEKKQKQK
jgi:hypothetical protein